MAGQTTYQKIVAEVERYLTDTKSFAQPDSKSNKQIISHLRNQINKGNIDIDATDGTMLSYLSNAANNDPDSVIVSGGPRAGYWIGTAKAEFPSPKAADVQKVPQGNNKSITISEKDLYPLVELWLAQKGYKAKDASSLKSGGNWGNPDIIGAERVELFGSVDVEIASCEVKLSDSNWGQFIFEAISHKRFANRSWYCYRVDGLSAPIPKNIEYYAERYRIGIVQICLTDKEIVDLKQKNDLLEYIDRVVERIPALYDQVPLREKRDLINRTGITLSLSF